MTEQLRLFRRHPDAILPTRGTPLSSGVDLYSCEDIRIPTEPVGGGPSVVMVDTGWDIAHIPPGWELQVRSRSGLAAKEGIFVVNSPGTVDADYRGPVKVILGCLPREQQYTSTGELASPAHVYLPKGSRIAQAVLTRVLLAPVTESAEPGKPTERGSSGFGSTGV